MAVFIEGGDTVGKGLVCAPVAVVLLAVAQKVAVKLLDVIFCDGDVGPSLKNRLHHLGIARNLLLIAAGEGFDFKVGEQALNVAVGYSPCSVSPSNTR